MLVKQTLTMDFITGQTIFIDKPYGWTSFDAVKKVRSILTSRYGLRKLKVGHAGTLDPLATGVMIICTGKATKQIEALQAGVKEYIAIIALGATTPSFDLETEIDATYPTHHITAGMVRDVLRRFVGSIQQIPPGYSAVKIDGRRAYKLARQGKEVELTPKTLVIDNIELLDYKDNDGGKEITIAVRCSKGTYIRALARDIGTALDSGAHLTALRRVCVGDIGIEQCMNIEEAARWLNTVPVEFPPDYDKTAIRKQ